VRACQGNRNGEAKGPSLVKWMPALELVTSAFTKAGSVKDSLIFNDAMKELPARKRKELQLVFINHNRNHFLLPTIAINHPS
jgi:hypothetical protein